MSSFPERSVGVLFSPVGDRVVVYDLVTKMVHQLSATAGAVLAVCDGVTERSATIEEWSLTTGTDPTVIGDGIDAILERFGELELVGRGGELVPPDPPKGSTREPTVDAIVGHDHWVIDHRIVFRASDPAQEGLVATIDEFLGPIGSELEHGPIVERLHIDVLEDPDTGRVTIRSDTVERHDDREALLEALPTLLNQYAVRSHGCITLHAGAARSPDGQIVVLPAESGSGKSTLTAMLIRAGWDYLGDEAIGIRSGTLAAVGYPKPLSIKAGGRAVLELDDGSEQGGSSDRVSSHVPPERLRADVRRLAGDVGPVTRIVLPEYQSGAVTRLVRLAPHEAVVELLANTFNLARIGQSGLDVLCDLAERVPVERLTFGSARDVMAEHFLVDLRTTADTDTA